MWSQRGANVEPKTMKRRTILQTAALGGASAVATIATAPNPAQSQESPAIVTDRQRWRLVSIWAKESDLTPHLKALVKQVEALSEGRFQLDIIQPSATQKVLEMVANGEVQMGHSLPELWASQAPATAYLMTIPFGLMPQEHYAWLHHGGGLDLADQVYGALGCKYLPGGNLGMQAAGWFKAEITPAQGVTGLKLQSRGLANEILQGAGAEIVSFTTQALPAAFERGDLDGLDYLGPAPDLAAKLYEVANYYYFPGWQRPASMLDFLINPGAWETLSPSFQAILATAVDQFNHQLLIHNLNRSSVAIDTLINQHQVQVRQFPEPLLLRLESLTGEILREKGSQDPMIEAIVSSLIAFRTRLTPWSRTSLFGYLDTRRWSWLDPRPR
jgi:TRAP-type mannitol/chloroaromatic compound transport system substrate-binding protein